MTPSYLALLQEAVIETDAIARHYYTKRDLVVSQKSDLSPVTIADQEIEQTLTQFFCKHLPDAAILGEEYGASEITRAKPFDLSAPYASAPSTGGLRVIIDPIDGTRNFVRGIPFVATLVAIEREGHIIAGLVSNPIQREQWSAEKGKGATYNGSPISVSKIAHLSESQAFHGSLYGPEAEGLPRDKVLKILSQTPRQRAIGDFYGHMLVASGAGEFSLDFGMKPWDIAPLKIIVEEAGGRVTNGDGGFSLEVGSLVCSNGVLHEALLAQLR
jgi:histidinol-phosphatase